MINDKMNDTDTRVATDGSQTAVADGPLTTAAIREGSPSLLLNEIDSRVVKVRPMSTPVDQISRMVGARPASSMVVDYYAVGTKGVSTELAAPLSAIAGGSYSDLKTYTLKVKEGAPIAVTETLLMKTASEDVEPLVLYVVEAGAADSNTYTVVCLNAPKQMAASDTLAPVGTTVVRMGRAAGELDVQTPQFETLPTKLSNYCQIFKAQVEQSTLAKLSAKEVGWTLSDQEEVAIMDMRLGMEKSFLFGVKARLSDPKRFDEVLFTGGIWNQTDHTYSLDLTRVNVETLTEMMKHAFTGDCAGSSRKILVAGSDLIEKLNCLTYNKTVGAMDTVTRWGIDFTELRSKFGTLYVVLSEVFDQCGHEKDGMIIDPQYLTKYSHIPFRVEHLDLKRSGVRNTDALVATEASCLVLRHPRAHMRVIGG